MIPAVTQLQIVRGAGKTAEILTAWEWPWPKPEIQNEDFPDLPKGARVRWAHGRQLVEAPAYPPSHLAALQREGFTVISYMSQAVQVEDGTGSEYLPYLCIAPGERPDSYRVIEWLSKEHPGNGYRFDGWRVSDGSAFGGVHETIHAALGWFTWHRAVKQAQEERWKKPNR